MTSETRETRVKRLYMRSIRRGIKEMDIILQRFADAHLQDMDDAELDAYEAVLNQFDQDLYVWISGQADAPEDVAPMLSKIMADMPARTD